MPCAWTVFLISKLLEAESVCVEDELCPSGPTEELSFPEAKGLVFVLAISASVDTTLLWASVVQ